MGGAPPLCSDLLIGLCIKSTGLYFCLNSLLIDASRYKQIIKNYWEHFLGKCFEKNIFKEKFWTQLDIESK